MQTYTIMIDGEHHNTLRCNLAGAKTLAKRATRPGSYAEVYLDQECVWQFFA